MQPIPAPEVEALEPRPEAPSRADANAPLDLGGFSLVSGGPIYRLWQRTGLTGNGESNIQSHCKAGAGAAFRTCRLRSSVQPFTAAPHGIQYPGASGD